MSASLLTGYQVFFDAGFWWLFDIDQDACVDSNGIITDHGFFTKSDLVLAIQNLVTLS